MTLLFDGLVHVHYGFFDVTSRYADVPDLGESRAGQTNGLLGARVPHCLTGITGLHTGSVPFRIEWLGEEPALGHEWEDVVEAPVDLPHRELGFSAFDWYSPLELPRTGPHRARYSAFGMDAGHEVDNVLDDETAPDRYLLQLWPAPERPDAVVRVGSAHARYWHSTTGGQRG